MARKPLGPGEPDRAFRGGLTLRPLDAFPTKKAQDDVVSAIRLLTTQVKDYAPSKPLMAEAVRFWLSHHPQGGTLPTLDEALASYLADKRQEKRRATTLYEITHKIGRFIKAFPDTPISDITAEHISMWLADTLASGTVGTKRQYLTVISAFFTDSAKRYGLPKNPAKDVKLAGCNADQAEVQAYEDRFRRCRRQRRFSDTLGPEDQEPRRRVPPPVMNLIQCGHVISPSLSHLDLARRVSRVASHTVLSRPSHSRHSRYSRFHPSPSHLRVLRASA